MTVMGDSRADGHRTGATPLPSRDEARTRMAGVARGSTANLMGAVVLAVCNLGLTVVVTRGLSHVAAGVFFSATSLFILAVNVGQLGTNTALVYFLSRCRSLTRPTALRAYLAVALRPVVVAAVLMSVCLFAFADPIAQLIAPEAAGTTATYLRVLAVFIPFAGLENVALAATRGLGTMRANVVVEQLGRPVLQLVMVTVAILLGRDGQLSWAWAACYLPAGVVAWLWWRRKVADADSGVFVSADRSMRREFWMFSGPRALASVGQVAMQRLDIVLVGALAGVPQAAIYAAATRFLVVGQMGNRAISLATQPRLGVALARDDKHAANHLYQIATAWLMLVTWPLYLLFIVFGAILLQVFGKGYDAGVAVLVVLACSMLLATGCGMVDMVLNMAGRTSWNLFNVMLALAVNLGLDLWLIPIHGVLGAAVGWACAIAVGNLVALSQVGFVLRLHPLGRATGTVAVLAVISFGVIPGVLRLWLGASWTALALAVLLGAAAYAGAVWKARHILELTALRHIRRRRG